MQRVEPEPGQSGILSPDLRPCDRSLGPGREPPLGAHIVTPRRWYTHHGIYVGAGQVIQYGGLSWGLRRDPVEEVSLSKFAQGHPVWVRFTGPPWFDPHEVARRARMRLGEDCYSVLTNNCEHFCEWCVRGEHRSYQVDERVCRLPGHVAQIDRAAYANTSPAARRRRGQLPLLGRLIATWNQFVLGALPHTMSSALSLNIWTAPPRMQCR